MKLYWNIPTFSNILSMAFAAVIIGFLNGFNLKLQAKTVLIYETYLTCCKATTSKGDWSNSRVNISSAPSYEYVPVFEPVPWIPWSSPRPENRMGDYFTSGEFYPSGTHVHVSWRLCFYSERSSLFRPRCFFCLAYRLWPVLAAMPPPA